MAASFPVKNAKSFLSHTAHTQQCWSLFT